jgi:hypothetical protein
MESIFRHQGLKELLLRASQLGPVESFEQAPTDCGIILRHDVDIHVRPAYEMSRLEKECGVRSTYFFLTTANTYNLNSTRDRKLIREMADEGFEIGLHFDPTIYGDISEEELQSKAETEAALIELVSGKKVRSISLHNPSIHGQYPAFNGFINAYDPEYFQPDNYLSDSRLSFRGKDPMGFIDRARTTRLQVLLHPIFYIKSGTYAGLLEELVLGYADDLDYSCSLNPEYNKEMHGRRLKEFIKHDDSPHRN